VVSSGLRGRRGEVATRFFFDLICGTHCCADSPLMCFQMKDRNSTTTALRAKPFTRSQVITVPHAMRGDAGANFIDHESPLDSPGSVVFFCSVLSGTSACSRAFHPCPPSTFFHRPSPPPSAPQPHVRSPVGPSTPCCRPPLRQSRPWLSWWASSASETPDGPPASRVFSPA